MEKNKCKVRKERCAHVLFVNVICGMFNNVVSQIRPIERQMVE
jgi:hypothetical protein